MSGEASYSAPGRFVRRFPASDAPSSNVVRTEVTPLSLPRLRYASCPSSNLLPSAAYVDVSLTAMIRRTDRPGRRAHRHVRGL